MMVNGFFKNISTGFHRSAVAVRMLTTTATVSHRLLGQRVTIISRQHQQQHQQQRGILTSVQEPDLTEAAASAVPERPCTVILAQDEGFYMHNWHDQFAQQLVTQQGMSYAQFSLSDNNNDTADVDTSLQELARDLAPHHPQTVLVARGPWMSWMAQLYLESLSLAGLVLVDPLALDDQNAINQFDLVYQKKQLENKIAYRHFQECVEHWDHWTLRIEPCSVPMLVLNSIARPGFTKAAENTARRHAGDSLDASDSPWDDDDDNNTNNAGINVALKKLRPTVEDERQSEDALQKIVAWIDERVL